MLLILAVLSKNLVEYVVNFGAVLSKNLVEYVVNFGCVVKEPCGICC